MFALVVVGVAIVVVVIGVGVVVSVVVVAIFDAHFVLYYFFKASIHVVAAADVAIIFIFIYIIIVGVIIIINNVVIVVVVAFVAGKVQFNCSTCWRHLRCCLLTTDHVLYFFYHIGCWESSNISRTANTNRQDISFPVTSSLKILVVSFSVLISQMQKKWNGVASVAGKWFGNSVVYKNRERERERERA